jgi:hypothetical protein
MKSHRTATAINNVTIKVIDEATGMVVQKHSGQNSVTTTLLEGIAHYLQGYGLDHQGALLKDHIPQFISLGTMGLRGYNAQLFELDDSRVDELNTLHFPADVPTRKQVPRLSSIHGGEFTGNVPDRNYFTHAPGFDADIRAEAVMYNLDNNERRVSGIGHPYAQIVEDFVEGYEFVEPTVLPHGAGSTTLYVEVESSTQFRVGDEINWRTPNGQVGNPVNFITAIDHEAKELWIQNRIGEILPAGTALFVTTNGRENYRRIDDNNKENLCGNPGCDCTCPCCNDISEGGDVPSPLPLECELVTHQHNRVPIIARRAFYPLSRTDGMNTAEAVRSIDVVYTALISLGALKAFRGNRDYIFITECGLWANRWNGDKYPTSDQIPASLRGKFKASADMLAGYRIFPAGWTPQDLTDNLVDIHNITNQPVTITPAQRYQRRMRQLQRSILRVGRGQVVQVEWKVQLLALDLSRDLFRQNYVTEPDANLTMNGRTLY